MRVMSCNMGEMNRVVALLRKDLASVTNNVQEALVSMASQSLGVNMTPTTNVVLTDGEVASVNGLLQGLDQINNDMVDKVCGDVGVAGGEACGGRRNICE